MDDNALMVLPHIDKQEAQQLAAKGLHTLPQLLHSLQQQQPGQQQQKQQQQRGSGVQLFSRDQVSSMLSGVLGGAGKASEVLSVAERLPILNVSWQTHQQRPRAAAAAAGAGAGAEHPLAQNGMALDGPHADGSSGSDEGKWVLEVQLQRQRPSGAKGGSSSSSGGVAPRVYAPLFPKVKEEGWWLVVGHRESQELLAMKRVSFGGKSSVKMNFPAFTTGGTELHTVTLFLLSDCYLGLDQQYDVILDQSAAAGAARAGAAAAARAAWLGGSGGSAAGAGSAAAAEASGSSSDAAASRRARRQQQMAARQQHQAGDVDGADLEAEWNDEPSCS